MTAELVLATPFRLALRIESDGERIIQSAFRPRLRPAPAPRNDAVLREAEKQLKAYFSKRLLRFELPLLLSGTTLQVRTWELVSQLEMGELISYGDLARAIGFPGAHRGVASAMGKSPYDLLIPAHRVIGSDGKIKGAGPNSIRRRLLQFEGIYLNS